jgi:hypothetical protein
MKGKIILYIAIGALLVFLIFKCMKDGNSNKHKNISRMKTHQMRSRMKTQMEADTEDCGSGYQFPPWPKAGDCAAWVNYLSSGYPTISSRGVQASNMIGSDWTSVCTNDQMNTIIYNTYAFYNESYPGYELDVAMVVSALSSIPDMTKPELCGVAKLITTPPTNPCQLADWKNNYMSTMTPSIQATLNKWLSYC